MGAILSTATATIDAAASLSNAVWLGNKVLVGIDMPAWDAADLTFQISYDGGTTFKNLYDSNGNEVTVSSPAASKYHGIDPDAFLGGLALKVRSGTSGTPVAQNAERKLTLVLRQAIPSR